MLQRFRFRGARAFLWRYREHLDVVHQVVDELVCMTDAEWREIRNPGGPGEEADMALQASPRLLCSHGGALFYIASHPGCTISDLA
ncbi:unnamed protein product, partial [marine sediment metagenome]